MRFKKIDSFDIMYRRYIGSYQQLSAHWCDFKVKYQEFDHKSPYFIEISHHDPLLTDDEYCVCDLCIVTSTSLPELTHAVIKGGNYAVCPYVGTAAGIFMLYQSIFGNWLPQSKLTLRHAPIFIEYISASSTQLELNLYIPIED